MFIDNKAQVPITLDGENTIYIRPRMGFGLFQQAQDALVAVDLGAGRSADPKMRIGAYNLALMILNIVAWTGPLFAGVECSAANIERLDPRDPLVEKVLSEINTRNAPREDTTDPNGGSASIAAGALPSPVA